MELLEQFFVAYVIINTVSLVLYTLWVGKRKISDEFNSSNASLSLPTGEQMREFVKWKLFYVNPRDPRGWLPKVNPVYGKTINFRDQKYVVIFVVLTSSLFVSVLAVIILAFSSCAMGSN